MLIDALSVLCAQLTRDLLAIAKFLFDLLFVSAQLSEHGLALHGMIFLVTRVGANTERKGEGHYHCHPL